MIKHCSTIRTDGFNTHLLSTCSRILFSHWTKWNQQEVTSVCGSVPTLHLSLQASILRNPLYVWSLFNQASPTDVGLLMYVWQRRLLWLTHATIAQLLCRQDDSATFLSCNPSAKKKERENNKSLTEIIGRLISYFVHTWLLIDQLKPLEMMNEWC